MSRKIHGSFPLFLVGMPRSGTKLLRGLLVQNPEIFIPPVETDFLLSWIHNWSKFGDLADYGTFQVFFESQQSQTYFVDSSNSVDCQTWYNQCRDYSVQGVFEGLIRVHTQCSGFGIYGDKSPSYLDCMSEIKTVFTNAKFIHIVRDVRDYALSVNKTWGKSKARASYRWAKSLRKAQMFETEYAEDYLVIKYEDLLQEAEKTLRVCCEFVGVGFSDNMLSLGRNYEPNGPTSGSVSIVATNCSKYIKLMNTKERYQIESLTADVLEMYGYPVEFDGPMVDFGRFKKLAHQIYDGYAMVRYDVKRLGLLDSILYHYKHYCATRGSYL